MSKFGEQSMQHEKIPEDKKLLNISRDKSGNLFDVGAKILLEHSTSGFDVAGPLASDLIINNSLDVSTGAQMINGKSLDVLKDETMVMKRTDEIIFQLTGRTSKQNKPQSIAIAGK